MVTEDDTKVIDPEFAVMGPMGFDVGKLLGNLLLSFFSQRGHERHARRARRLSRAGSWRRRSRSGPGSAAASSSCGTPTRPATAIPAPCSTGPEGRASLRVAQAGYMRRLFEDALGFAGAAMIRRTLGLAHNIDLETIEDPDLRAACERRNLRLARELLVGPRTFPTSPPSPREPPRSSGSRL